MKSERNSPDAVRAPLDPSRLQRVLLIRLRSIGDTVLMTPCLAALKAWRPDVKLAVVSEALAAPLLEDHPLVDELIVARRSPASRASLIARLRSSQADAAFNMHGGSTGAILTGLSGAKRTFGYRGLRLSWMLTDRAPAPDVILGRARVHSVEQQLALLEWSGVPSPAAPPRLSLSVSPQAFESVSRKIDALGANGRVVDGSFACIVPGAALDSKRWSAEGFAAVADHLKERWNVPSLVIAGPQQEALAREVASASRSQPSVLTGLSLKELVALLARSCVFVGNDSGPMHVASAFDRPIVAVWGSSNPAVWRPWTDAPWRVVGPAARGGGEDQDQSAAPAIRKIPASDVIAAVDEVLEPALDANHTSRVAGAHAARK